MKIERSLLQLSQAQSLRPPAALFKAISGPTAPADNVSLPINGQSQASLDLGLDPALDPSRGPLAFTESFPTAPKIFLDTRDPDQLAGLQNYLSRCAAFVTSQPGMEARIRAMKQGNSLMQALQKAGTGQLTKQDIQTLQRFLSQTADYDLGYRGHRSGIDGKYGRRTHQVLQQFLLSQVPAAPQPVPPPVPPQPAEAQLADWQQLAREIVTQRKKGLEMHDQLDPIYPGLLEKVSQGTTPIPASQDPLIERSHSMRPRVGSGYQLQNGQVLDGSGQPAQAAAVVFDRTHNLITALDAQGRPILAMEARNNTRQHFNNKSDQWMMDKSLVLESNAPAPNGVYAFGKVLRSDYKGGETFGPYILRIEGGTIAHRAILLHSRDNFKNREIPWNVDQNLLTSRTLGCILLQDPDSRLLASLVQKTSQPVALVVQGSYGKNLQSPQLVQPSA